ncbi:MAG TPA: tetratricopeptide repeat protein [Candidatus Angelobacter sp.]|nr:tetratricopeptide repeat protein [Candidatus Angelobacter sp.]
MIKLAVINLFALLLCIASLPLRLIAQEQQSSGQSQMLLVMPFENASTVPGIDWIGEAFPEVLGQRLDAGQLYIISRADRLAAFDQLGIPASARPSRATVYEIAQELDADYVVIGNYRFDGQTFTARARVMDADRLRLSPELTESGALNDLIRIQTALAWDVLNELKLPGIGDKAEFISQFAPMRLDALENYVRGVLASRPEERIRRFQQVVRLEPANTLALLQLGKAYYETKNYEQAINWLTKIPKADAKRNEGLFYLGLSAFYASQLDKAAAAFNELSVRLPLTEIFNDLGVVEARRADKSARGYFEKSVDTDPNDPDYHFNLAVELYRQGDTQGAARELRAALKLHNDPEARSFLDEIASGATQVARVPLERIKSNYNESSFRQLALEIENAEEAHLAKTDPALHAAFEVQRGQELLDQGLVRQAEKQFRKAVSLDPENAAAHAGMAQVLEAAKDPARARGEAEMALRLKPSPQAYLVLARLDLAQDRPADAKKKLEQALALDPDNAAAIEFKRDLTARSAGQPK